MPMDRFRFQNWSYISSVHTSTLFLFTLTKMTCQISRFKNNYVANYIAYAVLYFCHCRPIAWTGAQSEIYSRATVGLACCKIPTHMLYLRNHKWNMKLMNHLTQQYNLYNHSSKLTGTFSYCYFENGKVKLIYSFY